MSDYVVPRSFPERDKVGSALPDWDGRIGFVISYGAVGLLNITNGKISSIELKIPETENYQEIENSFTVVKDAVYLVSDYALYKFDADSNDEPVID